MPVPYVTFPGLAGNYISTPDTNILDADSAHCYQSIGNWQSRSGTSNVQLVTGVAGASMGGNVLQFDGTTDGAQSLKFFNVPTDPPVVTVGVGYVAAVRLRTLSGVAKSGHLVMEYYTDAGGFVGQTPGGSVTLPSGGSFVTMSVSSTAPTNAGVARMVVYVDDGLVGEQTQIDVAVIREGSDPSFVPSLRIVGDLDMSTRAQATDWAQSSDQYVGGVWGSEHADRAYTFRSRAGDFRFGYNTAGSSVFSIFTRIWGPADLVTLRVTREAASGDNTLYVDGQLAQTVSGTAGPSIVVESQMLEVGSIINGTSNPFAGRIYDFVVRDGIDGPVVSQFDAQDIPV